MLDADVRILAMGAEAYITINGEPLDERQAMVIRVAVMALADMVADQECFKKKGVRVNDQCVTDIGMVLAMIRGHRLTKTQ